MNIGSKSEAIMLTVENWDDVRDVLVRLIVAKRVTYDEVVEHFLTVQATRVMAAPVDRLAEGGEDRLRTNTGPR